MKICYLKRLALKLSKVLAPYFYLDIIRSFAQNCITSYLITLTFESDSS